MGNYRLNKFADTLFQGDLIAANQILGSDLCIQYDIKGVIVPAYNAMIPWHHSLSILKLPIDDHDSIPPQYLDLIAAFYMLMDKKVFVHCVGGINRSIAISAFLLSLDGGMEFDKAWKLVKKHTQSDCPYSELYTSIKNWFNTRNQ